MAARSLVQSMVITGGSKLAAILLSIVRMKGVALLTGPAGIGMLSVYNQLQMLSLRTADLGIGASAVREVAQHKEDNAALSNLLQLLLLSMLVQGVLAGLAIWLFREPISVALTDDASLQDDIALAGIAVVVGLLATAPMSFLQGLRRIKTLAAIQLISAFATTGFGIALVYEYRMNGLIAILLIQVIMQLLLAIWCAWRTVPMQRLQWSLSVARQRWASLAKLGSGFMLGNLTTTAALLAANAYLAHRFDLQHVGYFSAAWAISVGYVGVFLSSVTMDFYPRLSELIECDKHAAAELINQQVSLLLALAGPILVGIVGLAPWLITLLYSDAFMPAVCVLQCFTLGSVFRLVTQPQSLVLMAAAQPLTYFLTQCARNIVFIATLIAICVYRSFEWIGLSYAVSFMLYAVVNYLCIRTRHGCRFNALSWTLLLGYAVLLGTLVVASQLVQEATAMASVAIALLAGMIGARITLRMTGPQGKLAQAGYRLFAAVKWPIESAHGNLS